MYREVFYYDELSWGVWGFLILPLARISPISWCSFYKFLWPSNLVFSATILSSIILGARSLINICSSWKIFCGSDFIHVVVHYDWIESSSTQISNSFTLVREIFSKMATNRFLRYNIKNDFCYPHGILEVINLIKIVNKIIQKLFVVIDDFSVSILRLIAQVNWIHWNISWDIFGDGRLFYIERMLLIVNRNWICLISQILELYHACQTNQAQKGNSKYCSLQNFINFIKSINHLSTMLFRTNQSLTAKYL